jgi:hypothetical protein
MIRCSALVAAVVLAALVLAAPAGAAEPPCELTPRAKCYGVESLEASLSTAQAGDHPDLTFTFDIKRDPESKPNSFGLKDAYAPTRDVRVELPPGLIGDPSVLGVPQQCTAAELSLASSLDPKAGGCPNGSQVGVAEVFAYELNSALLEPVYMMQPPGGDVVARVGFVAGIAPVYIDATVRTASDYGVNLEVVDAATVVKLIRAKTTTWGIPGASIHDTERCLPREAILGCRVSPKRPPGIRALPFFTNPTRCGVPLSMSVNASSWVEPELFDENKKSTSFPEISGCDRLPFGPGLTIEPTNHRAGAPTGLDITARLPASDGVNVLEPSQTRDVRVALPVGVSINPSAADGLDVCSSQQVHLGEPVAAQCPDAAKVADFEAEIPALPRRLKGALYLREPEPGNPFRVWLVADDLGAHVKLQGQLAVDKQTGQIETVILDAPQAPLREMKIVLKSGFRAPLVNPPACGTYASKYTFVPWSGGEPVIADSPMAINEGCDGLGAFAPKLSAGSVDPTAGRHSPFVFTLTREDSEQNPAQLDVTPPKGFAATFAGIPRCEGHAAETGACPPGSRIGKVIAAVGAGPAPLWVPQPGKRPTAVYLSGPYRGAPLSIVAVVPRQAGPFDFGDEVVRSAIYVDPVTAEATAKADPLPQIFEGIPIRYRALHVELDRPGFVLNPTSCAPKATDATVTSAQGVVAHPSSPFVATNCANLGFDPKLSIHLLGGTRRGSHPKLTATLRMPPGGANIGATSVTLPHSEFIENAHFKTICTRVQFAAKSCPSGSIYGVAVAKSPLLDEPLEGPVYLRSSDHPLPDLVMALKGPASLPIEIDLDGHVDSANGGLRATFESVPDAPVEEFTIRMQGGSKGLIVNSTNLCASINRATAKFTAQNGKTATLHPALRASCRGRPKKKSRGRR